MTYKILPNSIDNTYNGHKIALYLFYVITFITVTRSLIHMFSPDGGAESIATIPLGSYSEGASHVIIHIFSEWGLSQLIMGILYIIVLNKYRSFIPLMYVFLLLEYSGRLFLGTMKPMETLSTPPGAYLNYIMIPLSILMIYLSTRQPNK